MIPLFVLQHKTQLRIVATFVVNDWGSNRTITAECCSDVTTTTTTTPIPVFDTIFAVKCNWDESYFKILEGSWNSTHGNRFKIIFCTGMEDLFNLENLSLPV